MREKIKQAAEIWRSDYQFTTLLTSSVAAVINIVFAVFNGILGIVYLSLWNGAICVYYILLSLIRVILIKPKIKKKADSKSHQRKKYIMTYILLLVMDISLIVPIAVMVKGERSYTYGLTPAIAMAAYTTYRIAMGIIHFCKSRKSNNMLVSELRMINLTDALVALLTMQNSLIYANGGMNKSMKTLYAGTSGIVFAFIVTITVWSFIKAKKENDI